MLSVIAPEAYDGSRVYKTDALLNLDLQFNEMFEIKDFVNVLRKQLK